MKFSLKNWSERIRSLLKKSGPQAPAGIIAMPGQRSTIASGKLKLPVIDWEKLYRKSFIYNSLAAVICGYFVADLLVASLTPWFPPMQAPRPRLYLSSDRRDFLAYSTAIVPKGKPNLFNEKGLVPDNDEGGGIDGPPVKTSLPLTLLGVIVLEDQKKSVASIEDKGANQVIAVREGEPITRETIVESITEDKVVFINEATSRREYIDLPRDQILATRKAAPAKPNASGISQVAPNHTVVDRKVIDEVMVNMATVLQDARCVPEFEGGRPAGYRCFQITPGSIYDKLGLKDNDVVCGLDGENLSDPSKIFAKLNTLKDPNTRGMQICIKRNGIQQTYQVDIN